MFARFPLLVLLLSAPLGCADKGTTEPDTADPDTTVADADGDGFDTEEDCDDGNSNVNPNAVEFCDGIDNNCDGVADEGVTDTFYVDGDGDGFGSDESVEACETPDGYSMVAGDCDDAQAESYPGNIEYCDGIDNDCDGTTDEDVTTTYYADADGDGHGDATSSTEDCSLPSGYIGNDTDCDDTDATISPNGTEVCDGDDNDCDGTTDEGAVDEDTFYADSDGDGFGDADTTTDGCSAPSGYTADDADCDDADVAINPDADEVCDEVDNDCDGDIDTDATDLTTYYADSDSDGYGSTVSTTACYQPIGYADNRADCDDGEALSNPGESEVCDEIDNDCDGDTDEGVTTTFYADDDSDGFGDPDNTTEDCEEPSGYLADSTDCDDTDSAINPDADEICDGDDNDCDGDIDEDSADDASTFYADGDGDGYGDSTTSEVGCESSSGYVEDYTDCDDDNAAISPDADEICDTVDNDCDGDIDEGTLGTDWQCLAEHCAEVLADNPDNPDGDYWLDFDGDGYGNQYTCDMTTDGGGWTQVVTWDRETDGDDWTDLESELDTNYDNMTTKSEDTTYLYWADLDASSDVLAYERPVSFSNDGEILLDVHYYGYSMEGSAAFFYAETSTADEDILCKEDNNGSYSTTEYTYWPYTCSDSAATTWTWDDVYQDAFSDEIEVFHFRTFMYDYEGDFSYLYRLNVWIR